MNVRLIYSGPGRGHIVRMEAISQALSSRRHNVIEQDVRLAIPLLEDDWIVLDLSAEALKPRGWIDGVITLQMHVAIICDTVTQENERHPLLDQRCDLLVLAGANTWPNGLRAKKVLAGPYYMPIRSGIVSVPAPPVETRPDNIVDLRNIHGLDENGVRDLLHSAKVAITSGGVRAMECAAMGTPAIYIIESEDQREQCIMLSRAGCGFIAYRPGFAQAMAESLARHPATLREMSETGRRTVDGLGASRIVTAMENMA